MKAVRKILFLLILVFSLTFSSLAFGQELAPNRIEDDAQTGFIAINQLDNNCLNDDNGLMLAYKSKIYILLELLNNFPSQKADLAADINPKPGVIIENPTPTASAPVTAPEPAPAPAPAPAPTKAPTVEVSQDAFTLEILRLVNIERAEQGLDPLVLDNTLSAAAAVRAKEATELFSHTRPDGSSTFTVLAEFGLTYRRAGENIAIGQLTPAQVVQAWMDSEGHRNNILGDFALMGIGYTPTNSDYYLGYAWAQLFIKEM